MKKQTILWISLIAGGGDFCTGLVLIAAPDRALALMGVPTIREPMWIQYIGVFVACVGFSYIAGLFSWRRSGSQMRLRAAWELTILFRGAVGCFVGTEVLRGGLQPGWSMVVAIDWFWAAVQTVLICGRFFEQP